MWAMKRWVQLPRFHENCDRHFKPPFDSTPQFSEEFGYKYTVTLKGVAVGGDDVQGTEPKENDMKWKSERMTIVSWDDVTSKELSVDFNRIKRDTYKDGTWQNKNEMEMVVKLN